MMVFGNHRNNPHGAVLPNFLFLMTYQCMLQSFDKRFILCDALLTTLTMYCCIV